MKWEDFEEGILALNPDDRPWEYDGDGTKIYKLEWKLGHSFVIEC